MRPIFDVVGVFPGHQPVMIFVKGRLVTLRPHHTARTRLAGEGAGAGFILAGEAQGQLPQ